MTRSQRWLVLVLGIIIGIVCIVFGVHLLHHGHSGYHPKRGAALLVVGVLFVLAGAAVGFVPRLGRRRDYY